MKQRIDVKVRINGDKDRTKALTIAAGMMGVRSVRIGGEDKNILSVIGNEVDIVNLIKKLGSATLVRVVPLSDINGGFDQEEAAASMIYQGQSKYYGNNYTYSQPKYSYYNPPLVSQYPAPPPPPDYYYYYSSEPGDSSCSIM